MKEADDRSDKIPELEAPEALQRDLATAFGRRVQVPKERDQRIIASLNRQLKRKLSSGSFLSRRALAAAAALVLAVSGFLAVIVANRGPENGAVPLPQTTPVASSPPPQKTDTITIVDAFLLARALEQGETIGKTWDFNNDGTVDSADVDALAMAAVSLDRGVGNEKTL